MESFSNELQNALRKPLKDFVKTKMTEAELNNFIKRFKKFQSINDTRFLLVTIERFWDEWTSTFSRRNVELKKMRELLNILSHPCSERNFTWINMDDHMKDFYSFLDILSTSEYNIESARHARKEIEALWEKIEKKGYGPFYNYTIESIYRVRIIPEEHLKEEAALNIGTMLGIDINPDDIILDLKQFNEIKSFVKENILGQSGRIDNSEDYYYYMVEQMDEDSYAKFRMLHEMIDVIDDIYIDDICIFRRKETLKEMPLIGGVRFEMKHLDIDTFMIKSNHIEEVEKRLKKGNIEIIAKSHKIILVKSKREVIEKFLSTSTESNGSEKLGKKKNKSLAKPSQSPLKKKKKDLIKQDDQKVNKIETMKKEKVPSGSDKKEEQKSSISKDIKKQQMIPIEISESKKKDKEDKSINDQPDPLNIIQLIYKIDIKSENEWSVIEKTLKSALKNQFYLLIEKRDQYSLAFSFNDQKLCEEWLNRLGVTYCIRQNQVYFSKSIYSQYFMTYKEDIEIKFRCKITSTILKNKGYRFGIIKRPAPLVNSNEFVKFMMDIISFLCLKEVSVDIHKSHLNSFEREIKSISNSLRVLISLDQKNHSSKDGYIDINASLLGFKSNVLKAVDLIKNMNEKSMLSKQISNLQIQQTTITDKNDDKPLKIGYHYLIYFRRSNRLMRRKIGRERVFTGELKKEIEEKMKNICVKRINVNNLGSFIVDSKYIKEKLKEKLGIHSNKKVKLIKLQGFIYIMTENNDYLNIASQIIENYLKELDERIILFSKEEISIIKDILNLPRKMRSISIHPYDYNVHLQFGKKDRVIIKGLRNNIDSFVEALREKIKKYPTTEIGLRRRRSNNKGEKNGINREQIDPSPQDIRSIKKEDDDDDDDDNDLLDDLSSSSSSFSSSLDSLSSIDSFSSSEDSEI